MFPHGFGRFGLENGIVIVTHKLRHFAGAVWPPRKIDQRSGTGRKRLKTGQPLMRPNAREVRNGRAARGCRRGRRRNRCQCCRNARNLPELHRRPPSCAQNNVTSFWASFHMVFPDKVGSPPKPKRGTRLGPRKRKPITTAFGD